MLALLLISTLSNGDLVEIPVIGPIECYMQIYQFKGYDWIREGIREISCPQQEPESVDEEPERSSPAPNAPNAPF